MTAHKYGHGFDDSLQAVVRKRWIARSYGALLIHLGHQLAAGAETDERAGAVLALLGAGEAIRTAASHGTTPSLTGLDGYGQDEAARRLTTDQAGAEEAA